MVHAKFFATRRPDSGFPGRAVEAFERLARGLLLCFLLRMSLALRQREAVDHALDAEAFPMAGAELFDDVVTRHRAAGGLQPLLQPRLEVAQRVLVEADNV